MAYSEDQIALAAEYALGTLDADERAQVETMMAADKEFAAIVQAWEFRLGVLNQMVGSVEPRPLVWDNIRRAIGHGGEQAPLVLPEAPPPPPPSESEANDNIIAAINSMAPPPASPVAEGAAVAAESSNVVAEGANVIQLNSRVRRWRNAASVASAIAAALLYVVANSVPMLGLTVVGREASTTVFGGAMQLWTDRRDTVSALRELQTGLKAKAAEFAGVLKMGRTENQDAVPMTLGQEFGAYAVMIGDAPTDIAAGRAVGARTVLVLTGVTTPERLAALPRRNRAACARH